MANDVVLILGAGFSAVYGLPVMANFPRYIRNHDLVSDDDKRFIIDLQRQTRNISNSLDVTETNLESMLSVAVMKELIFSNSSKNNISKQIRNILRKVCTPAPDLFPSNSNAQKNQILRVLGPNIDTRSDTQLTIITTNYDIIIDYFLATIGMKAYLPGIQIDSESENLYSHLLSNVHLCKLHGSTNWYENSDGVLTTHDHLEEGIVSSHPKHLLPSSWKNSDQNPSYPSDPFIIPPTLYKAEAHSGMRTLWSVAGQALSNASRIVSIGFSFPDSDSYFKYFFASCLQENMTCEKIEIVDPNANSIVSKLKSKEYGLSGGVHNKLFPINSEWQSTGSNLPPLSN
jgi:SIR2-like domain